MFILRKVIEWRISTRDSKKDKKLLAEAFRANNLGTKEIKRLNKIGKCLTEDVESIDKAVNKTVTFEYKKEIASPRGKV